jgi:hypothetical protein
MDLGQSYIQYVFLQYIIIKIEVCFPLWQVGHRYLPSAETRPQKMRCYKVVAVRLKTSPRALASRRLVPRYATKKFLLSIRVVGKSYGTLWIEALKRSIFKRKKGA